jgi:hypothetical protein
MIYWKVETRYWWLWILHNSSVVGTRYLCEIKTIDIAITCYHHCYAIMFAQPPSNELRFWGVLAHVLSHLYNCIPFFMVILSSCFPSLFYPVLSLWISPLYIYHYLSLWHSHLFMVFHLSPTARQESSTEATWVVPMFRGRPASPPWSLSNSAEDAETGGTYPKGKMQ